MTRYSIPLADVIAAILITVGIAVITLPSLYALNYRPRGKGKEVVIYQETKHTMEEGRNMVRHTRVIHAFSGEYAVKNAVAEAERLDIDMEEMRIGYIPDRGNCVFFYAPVEGGNDEQ